MKSPFLNVTEAAAFLQLRVSTLYALTSRRQVPHIKRGGKLYFIQDELSAWVIEGKRPTIGQNEAQRQLSTLKNGRRNR